MDGAVERERNGALIGILVFLCVAIVGLAIGIVVVWVANRGGGGVDAEKEYGALSEEAMVIVEANDVCGEISGKYLNNENYTFEEAVSDLRASLQGQESADYRVNLATCSANFVDAYGEDIDLAIDFLKTVEGEVSGVNNRAAGTYYNTLSVLCGKGNRIEEAEYYNRKASEYAYRGTIIDEV